MNIVSLNMQDSAGLSIALCEAINEHTSHHATCITRYPNFYMELPTHICAPHATEETSTLIKNADVIHFNEVASLPHDYSTGPCGDKTVVVHMHGYYRQYTMLLDLYKKQFPHMKLILSTPDLYYVRREGEWFPSIVRVDHLRREYPVKRSNPPVVYFSPTWTGLPRGDRAFKKVCRKLQREGLSFHAIMRTHIPHAMNLRLKSRADIYFDELGLFYGVNALEAAVFEMPVLCGMAPMCTAVIGEEPPFNIIKRSDRFKDADTSMFKRELRNLIEDKQLRHRKGREALKYVRRVHDVEPCLERFFELCEN